MKLVYFRKEKTAEILTPRVIFLRYLYILLLSDVFGHVLPTSNLNSICYNIFLFTT